MERGGYSEVDCCNPNNETTAVATGTLNVFNANHFNDTHVPQQQEIYLLSGRSMGLRRQPTKYPHGLTVCVQTVCDEDHRQHITNYSRASTLRSSSWDGKQDVKCHLDVNEAQQRKYQTGGMFTSPENFAELQVRRYKYPLIGNYYHDPQDAATKSTMATLDYAKRFCKWKYSRWPLIFVGSVLLFFGLITYSIWLHDISVARERYLHQRKHNYEKDDMPDNEVTGATTIEVKKVGFLTTEGRQVLQESTILRSLSSRSRYIPRAQKLTTVEYALSKGVNGWDKERKDVIKDTHYHIEQTAPLASETAALEPSLSDLHPAVTFTSGHQKSFGISVEDDERVLRLINGLFPSTQQFATDATVDSIVNVSPTIPSVRHIKPIFTMTTVNDKSMALDNRCYSTSLTMCQDVLGYDLTYNVSMQLVQRDLSEYQALVISNCSARSVEFVCAVLEPECRPSHIGILPPCRRICKAILEACSEIIANSDVLTATFDCSLYPDSNDPHRCEDPTRRKGYCYTNELECYDHSCIPNQWQCDNIKDCPAGEDEDNCLVCDGSDEFRCRSNEKCVSDSARCDMKYDCFDGSDEDDCSEYDSAFSNEGGLRFGEEDINAFPRVFSYASIISQNYTNDRLYITASTDDQILATKFQLHTATNRTSGVSKEDVTNSVPAEGQRSFVNFRDSKEIMMTSDSENNFKFSSARENHSSKKYSASTTPLQPAASHLIAISTEPPTQDSAVAVCAPHQLRCVSGKCITVGQLCDKKQDCPDGFDELMCVYKDRTTTVRSRGTTIIPNPFNSPNINSNTTRSYKRTIRTTVKRKVKP